MKYLFPEYKDEQRQEIANDAAKKLKKETDLKEQLQFWIKLKKVTEQMKEYYPYKDKIKEDEKWKEFVKVLTQMEEVTKANEDISIEQTLQHYNACIECVGESDKSCMIIGLFDVLVRFKDNIKILAENQNFNDETHFDNTLDVLSKSKHHEIQDLLTSLRRVNSTMREALWKCPLEDMASLAKAILKLHSNGQEFIEMLKKCCDIDLDAISTLVNEADKIRTEKSLKQLKDAMAFGEWQFASCEDILKGKKGKQLNLKINDTVWFYEEIGENIDRVLLGVEKKELKKIESVIQQFEECKDISSYQIEFWEKGGRIDIEDNKPLKLPVRSQIDEFEDCKKLWKQRLMEWKKQCFELRERFPALNYFCFNQVHFLIKKINQLNMPNCPDRAIKASKYIKPFLQKIKYNVTDRDVNDVLKDWIDFDFKDLDQHNVNDNNNNFRQRRDSIAKFGQILHRVWISSQHNCVDEKPFSIGLHAGKPNLIIGSKNLFKLLGLFESQHFIPRAEHVLICNETTTEEDIACLIFRAITNHKRMPLTTKIAKTTDLITITETNHKSAKPLYCLVYPEKLTPMTLNQICQDIHELLLSDIRLEQLKNNFYTFVVLSSNQENSLCKTLAPFKVKLHNLSFETLSNQMLSGLYRNQWANSWVHYISTEPPWIQLYTSEKVAMGKSTLIQRDIQRIREIHKTKTVHEICVAFNGKDIDWMKIMDRLWSYHPCSNDVKDADIDEENTLIIYHLNISSCVSKLINDFLFELLFLQHINSNSQISQCFHVNPNMIFLIEIPSTLNRPDFTVSPKKCFYLFFSTVKFPTVEVSPQNNKFEFGKEAQYVIKWMQEFFNGNFKFFQSIFALHFPFKKTKDDRMRRFMEKYFNEIANSSPAHQRSFFKYLYQQFLSLAQSTFLNQSLKADKKSIQWKHEITKSVIKVATISCCRQYDHIKLNAEEKDQKIESTGEEEFYLCKKWHKSKECCYLVNQDRESISVLISNKKKVSQKQLDEFQNLGFHLVDWQKDLKERELALQVLNIICFISNMKEPDSQTEKEERLRLLFRILGIPNQGIMKECEEKKVETIENLHDQTVNKLCNNKEWSNYVLTFDNILKMIAIFMKIQTSTPVILMGETGCGKTSLIKFLGHVVNVQLIAVDVHAGFGRYEIRQVMENCNERLSKDNGAEIWIFLDE
ncbi:hypothetical protein RFI_36600, partial [Reticulomyxa filosa]